MKILAQKLMSSNLISSPNLDRGSDFDWKLDAMSFGLVSFEVRISELVGFTSQPIVEKGFRN